MTRKEELMAIFEGSDENVSKIVNPMIDDLVFIEEQLVELRKQPFIRYHPNDPSIQKATAASKLYKDLLAQSKDIVRILCSQIHKGGSEGDESPLDNYFRSLGKS